MIHLLFDINAIKKQNKIRKALMTNICSKNKLINNAAYNEKTKRKTIIFRPQDTDLYEKLSEVENGKLSELVRDLLKKHFDNSANKNNNSH